MWYCLLLQKSEANSECLRDVYDSQGKVDECEIFIHEQCFVPAWRMVQQIVSHLVKIYCTVLILNTAALWCLQCTEHILQGRSQVNIEHTCLSLVNSWLNAEKRSSRHFMKRTMLPQVIWILQILSQSPFSGLPASMCMLETGEQMDQCPLPLCETSEQTCVNELKKPCLQGIYLQLVCFRIWHWFT